MNNWPRFGFEEALTAFNTVRSGQLFAAKNVKEFEDSYAAFIGSRYCLGVGNATQGLHLALAALDIGIGDEVIVTPYSWISSASCVLMQNAIPVFCDIEELTYGLDPVKVEAAISSKTKAVILVHMFGYPSQVNRIRSICDKYSIYLIEDNSHAHGAVEFGRMTGTIGNVGVASLHQRKSLPVGDGGIITTDDHFIYEKIRRLRSFGHEELSYNYRMTEIAAAIGRVRLKRLLGENRIRQHRYRKIKSILHSSDMFRVLEPLPNTESVFYAVLIHVDNYTYEEGIKIRSIIDKSRGVLRFTWAPLTLHPHFSSSSKPARGNPWELAYDLGLIENQWEPNNCEVASRLLPNQILEFYVHPTISEKVIRDTAHSLATL